jgi:hypothetical protein
VTVPIMHILLVFVVAVNQCSCTFMQVPEIPSTGIQLEALSDSVALSNVIRPDAATVTDLPFPSSLP